MVLFGKTLYYPGCVAKLKARHIADNYEKILRQIGIDFITIKDIELCCGIPALQAGYRNDFLEIVDRNREIFKNQGITRIITSCPTCCNVFNKEYGIKAEHIVKVINDNIRKIKKGHNGIIINYHDPCSLGRKAGIYDEPRNILGKIGFEVKEMKTSGKDALCCGSGGLLKENSPSIANKAASARMRQATAGTIITSCTRCYLHLKENARGIEVLELSEVLL